jgi:hypothetical protein
MRYDLFVDAPSIVGMTTQPGEIRAQGAALSFMA